MQRKRINIDCHSGGTRKVCSKPKRGWTEKYDLFVKNKMEVRR